MAHCRACRLWMLAVCLILGGCGVDRVTQLRADLNSGEVETRRAAARELGTLAPPGAEVQTALETSTADSDREVRRLACHALGAIGRADEQVLVRALEDRELSVRLAAAYALLKIEPGHTGAVAVLIEAMKLGDGGVIVAVTKGGPRSAWAVPTLTGLLQDRRPGIRRLAAEGLGQIGSAASSALPALRQAEQDQDDRVRGAASQAIELIAAGAAPAAP